MKRLLLSVISLILFLLLAGGGYAAYEAHRFLTTPASESPEEIVFSIAPGSTFIRVAWDLKKAGAITDVPRFQILAEWKGAVGKVKAGEFLINTGWTPEEVLTQITEGRVLLYRLTLREGLTWWETARAIEEQGFARYDDLKAVFHDPEFLREHHIPFANAEGFLQPETYLLKKPPVELDRKQAREVASTMVTMFWKQTEPIWRELPSKTEVRLANEQDNAARSMQSPPLQPVQAAQQPPAANAVPPAGNGTATVAAASAESTAPAPQTAASSPLPASGSPANSAALPAQGKATTGPQSNGTLPAQHNGTAALTVQTNGTAAPQSASPQTALRPHAPQSPADIDPEALKRLIILASLVERETGVPSERARVAGVYANRLRIGMLLQCDPTIIYGVGENFSGEIRRSQINDPKNRYNTYQHAGLPPGPICSSGREAVKAAAQPEEHKYLYFVATGLDGGHTFSKTLQEHNRAVQVYRSRIRGNR